MRRLLPCALLATTLIGCSAPTKNLHVLPKEIEISDDKSEVTCRGRWEQSERSFSPIPTINAVILRCSRVTMQCQESVAMVTTPEDHLAIDGLVSNALFEYTVSSWKSDVIEAAAETRALDLHLTIDVAGSNVTRTSHETTARGAKTSAPESHRWALK
jgi:hypothetical protein